MALHTKKIDFRLPPEDYEEIFKKAQERHLSVSEYIRCQARTKVRLAADPKIRSAMQELLYEINKIGTNINQITKRHNSRVYTKEDKKQLSDGMERLEDLMEEIREMCSGALEQSRILMPFYPDGSGEQHGNNKNTTHEGE